MPQFSILEEHAFPSRVRAGLCTPVLGPELTKQESADRYDLIERWKYGANYPFGPNGDLPRVAEYLAVSCDKLEPRLRLADDFTGVRLNERPDRDVFKMLADFQLPIYICTSYHDLMRQALEADRIRKPSLQCLAWNDTLRQKQMRGDPFYDLAVEGSPSHPVVLHWFGQVSDRDSLVISERDYMDFLFNTAAVPECVPPAIDRALSSTYVLFLGFRLFDLHFQTLLRSVKRNLANNEFVNRHIAVQFVDIDDGDEKQRQHAEQYLKRYLDQEKISVEVGDPVDFVVALHEKIKESADGAKTA